MPALIKNVRAKGMKSVAVTDHGNLFGTIEFYRKAKAAGIKPHPGDGGVRRRTEGEVESGVSGTT